ncbi:maltase A1-like [Planococcus citri]|uniref:maltase A1-like n=1 Tax=Planococcus citri TaxID=170843 RepID=UPI0031FA28DD
MKVFGLLLSFFCFSSSFEFEKLDTEWWKNTIIYELIPYTFKDSDGDGIGDLKGITSKLDHFVDLGIETIHLTPMYKTTLKDMGYDVSDYYAIEPKLGTMDDFDELVREMKKRKMKLILDLVINHSGYEHEWFQKSIDRIHPYTNFYVWRNPKYLGGQKIPPNNWRSIFSLGTPGSGWTWNDKRKQYYFHQFLPEQPDFDLNHKILKNELKKMIKFWLDKGVAGFRLDASPFYFEDKSFLDDGYEDRQMNQPEVLQFIHEFRLFLDQYNQRKGGPERIFIAEVHSESNTVVQYYGKPDYRITHFPYTFLFEHFHAPTTATTLQSDIEKWMNILPEGAVSAWMTQDHDGARVGSRIIPEYGDIFTMITMTLPGTVGVYYGQEISMENGFITRNQIRDFSGGGSRDPARLLMQWDDSTNAGFSSNSKPYLPPNSDYFQKNVEDQKTEVVSHYNMFKDVSILRHTDAFKIGKFSHYAISDHIYVIIRSHEHHVFTLVVNFDTAVTPINLTNILKNPPNRIVMAATSTNAGYLTGFILEPNSESANEFHMRPLSAVLFETIHPSL